MQYEEYTSQLPRLFPETQGKVPKSVTFAVTDDCTLRCTYCYQCVKGHHTLFFETARKFIHHILDNEYVNEENASGLIMEFIGGEPLIEIDLIDQITDYFIEQLILRDHPWAQKYIISICSNGTEYFDPRVQRYLRRHRHHLSFSISIDGDKALHDACRVYPDGRGSYDIAMQGVRHFKDVLHGDMGSKMTLCPENIDKTSHAVKSLIENGYEHINLNCVYEEGWTAEHALTLYTQLKQLTDWMCDSGYIDKVRLSIFEQDFFKPKAPDDVRNWCGGTGDMISVDYTGNIYPCIRYMPNSLGEGVKPLTIGHVDTGIMRESCHRDCVDCLRKIDRRTQSTDECFDCPIAEGCSWCSAYNYQTFGTPDKRATFICVMHKARALANAYYWNTQYRQIGSAKRHVMHIPDAWALEIIPQAELDMLKELAER